MLHASAVDRSMFNIYDFINAILMTCVEVVCMQVTTDTLTHWTGMIHMKSWGT